MKGVRVRRLLYDVNEHSSLSLRLDYSLWLTQEWFICEFPKRFVNKWIIIEKIGYIKKIKGTIEKIDYIKRKKKK